MFSRELLHTDEQVLSVRLEPIYNSLVQTQDVVWRTSRMGGTIRTGGEGESGESMHAVRHDDDDDDAIIRQKYLISYDYAKKVIMGVLRIQFPNIRA